MKSYLEKVSAVLFGPDRDLSNEGNRRFILVMAIGLLAACVLIGVATGSVLYGELKTALVDYFASIFVLILLAFYRWTTYQRQCRYVGVAMMYALYLYLFVTQAADGSTYMWHYTFPFFAIFLIGSRHGFIATILLFIPVFALVIQDALTPSNGMYSASFAIRFIPSVSVALIFAFLFDKERERFRFQARRAYQEQESIITQRSEQLHSEIAAKEQMSQKLRQSQKMEAIGTMASGVAHDLNNILSGVVTYPQIIRMGLPVDSPITKPLEAIEQAGKRAAMVVNDLLTLARNAASVKEPINLNSLIEELLGSPEWQTFVKPHPDLQVKVKLGAELAFVYCSPVHIRKSIMNLLINAVEATLPQGMVTISTINSFGTQEESFEQDTTPSYICVSITDEGAGVSSEHLEHIFEPFYTTKKMGRSGSGLGLSVVWNTIEEHQGEVSVENTPSGARFSFQLEALDEAHSEKPPLELSIDDLHGTGHILIIEDDPQLADLAYNIIYKLGYTGLIAASGEEALQHINNHDFDLILLDMFLGDGLGGYETFKEIISIIPNQKAIIVSGYSTSEDVKKTIELGACTIIKKPYSMEEIGKAIQACFKA